MAGKRLPYCTATVLDDAVSFTLHEICRSCGVGAELIAEMVSEGILIPEGASEQEWCFGHEALRRAHTALRLQSDLGVNLAGAALALDLLDEIARLRRIAARLDH